MTNQEAIKILRQYVSSKEHYEATKRAIGALEKRTPARALNAEKYHPYSGCPSCKFVVTVLDDYCRICGQAIDWGVNNEKD